MPHLLLYGPPGTGKTSTILACARKIFNEKEMPSMVLEVILQTRCCVHFSATYHFSIKLLS